MNLLQEVQSIAIKRQMPDIRPGVTVRIHQKIQEGGKTRIQIYEGIVIKINSGFGADKTIKVRKVTDGIGVEKTYPLYSTIIDKITVIKSAKVRRAKLFYLRERFGKSARMKEELMGKDAKFSSREFEEEKLETTEPIETETEAVVEQAENTSEVQAETPELKVEEKVEETKPEIEEVKAEEVKTEVEPEAVKEETKEEPKEETK